MLGLALVATSGVALAGKPRKVHIESEPTGAVVYLNNENEDDAGQTPLDIQLAPGTYDIILKLNDYKTQYTTLEVPKPTRRDKKKPVEITVQLEPATALIEVVGAPTDATVQIDKMPKLEVKDYPDGFDVPAGGHAVVVEVDGKALFNDFVEVEADKIKTITVRGKITVAGGGDGGGDGDGDGGGDGDGDGGRGTTVTTTVVPSRARTGPIFAVGPMVEVGWRDFTYQGMKTSGTLPITQSGEALIGLAIDINPFRLTGFRPLHPLAIVLAGGFGVPQAVADDTGTLGTDLKTFWQRFQAGLRYRFGLGAVDLDLEAGYGGYVYRFSGNTNDIDRLPDASYQCVRIGGRLGIKIAGGMVEPYVGGENRAVVSGGEIQDRFRNGASAQGYAFRGGLDLALASGKLTGRLEFNYGKFEWTFKPDPPDFMVTGGTDTLYHLGFVLGYAY